MMSMCCSKSVVSAIWVTKQNCEKVNSFNSIRCRRLEQDQVFGPGSFVPGLMTPSAANMEIALM